MNARSAIVEEGTAMPARPNFERIYRENFAFVWRSLRHLGVPDADLPDAAQDVFVVVHRKLATFQGRSRVSTWLYGICLRAASERRRREKRRKELAGDGDGDQAPTEFESAPVDLADLRALLERTLDAMPLEQRAVFTLFELEGMTGEEIATLLEIPTPTAHSRLRLARETFRRLLDRVRTRETFDLRRLGEGT